MNYILCYLALGLLWAGWLEWYCCTSLEFPYNKPFSTKERVFNIFIWPWAFGVFIYNIMRDCLK